MNTTAVKVAIGLYSINATSTVYLGGVASNLQCKYGLTATGTYPTGGKVWYSVATDTTRITAASVDGAIASSSQVVSSSLALTDGTGWLPVNLDNITGGSPISNMPIDPTNAVTAAAPVNTDLVYRYGCNASSTTFELDAVLESQAYTLNDIKAAKDGGNNNSYYEVGTNLKILGAGTTF